MGEYLAHFMRFWSAAELNANIIIFLNLSGALLLGYVVGYERFYHGRAAGMRTYGLVCMASAALVVVTGYPDFWFGGGLAHTGSADPTRVMQGVVTGIGFLGAGVIMKDGFSISGLTTAASLWASSAIGVLVGVGFYAAAILLALLSAASMVLVRSLEERLPARAVLAVTVNFERSKQPDEAALKKLAVENGYELGAGTLSIFVREDLAEWHFVAVAVDKHRALPMSQLSAMIENYPGVVGFALAHAKN